MLAAFAAEVVAETLGAAGVKTAGTCGRLVTVTFSRFITGGFSIAPTPLVNFFD